MSETIDKILKRRTKIKSDFLKVSPESFTNYINNYFFNKIVIYTDNESFKIEEVENLNNVIIFSDDNINKADFYVSNEKVNLEDFNLNINFYEFCKITGVKIILTDKNDVYVKKNEFFESKGINILNLNILERSEIKNILNFRNLIVIREENINYTVSGLIRNFIRTFDKIEISELFLLNGIKIVTTKNILDSHYFESNNKDFLKIIFEKNLIKNPILFGIHPTSFEEISKYKGKNCTTVAWQDDLHYFANFAENRKVIVQNYQENYDCNFLEEIDFIISPSLLYFENLKIKKHQEKYIDLFYILPFDFFDKIDDGIKERKNQIILSGEVNAGYPLREKFKKLSELDTFKDLIFHLEHPGYKQNEHLTDLNYYKKLSEYKGAFVSNYKYPLDFPLAKHIECLMCGNIGFFQKHKNLEKQLGLKEFKHYVPCTDDFGNLITNSEYYKYYLNSEEGTKIALSGQDYVKKKFGQSYLREYINFFVSIS